MASIDIPVEFFTTLKQHVDKVSEAVDESIEVGKQSLYEGVSERMEQYPQWDGLIDHLDSWSDDGRFWIGIRTPQFVSEAFIAEYGTGEYPPEPVLRDISGPVRKAQTEASDALRDRLGGKYS